MLWIREVVYAVCSLFSLCAQAIYVRAFGLFWWSGPRFAVWAFCGGRVTPPPNIIGERSIITFFIVSAYARIHLHRTETSETGLHFSATSSLKNVLIILYTWYYWYWCNTLKVFCPEMKTPFGYIHTYVSTRMNGPCIFRKSGALVLLYAPACEIALNIDIIRVASFAGHGMCVWYYIYVCVYYISHV